MTMTSIQRRRSGGILLPVFSMRRAGDIGIGDTTSVKLFLKWFKDIGVNFLQVLPINITGGDNSPYSALSSVALDPVYVDVSLLGGVSETDIELALQQATSDSGVDFIHASKVEYHIVKQVKSGLLRIAYDKFAGNTLKTEDHESFEQFKKEEAEWLDDYCKYGWLMVESGGVEDWGEWPADYNTAEKAAQYEVKCRESRDAEISQIQDFHAWEQWVCFNQWREVRAYADSIDMQLMGDIPIGVSSASVDVFFEQQWFDLDWYGGAPPEKIFKDDPFTVKWGQNWGVPLYKWSDLAQHDFSWWRRRIGKLTDVFHIFRIDHILGFYRIYSFPWHPKYNAKFLPLDEEEAMQLTGGKLPGFLPQADDTIVNRAKNLVAGDEYLKMVKEAANGAVIVGEDLGMVPEYVRPHLSDIDIPGYKIIHENFGDDGRVLDPAVYDECAFATYMTHDHPSMLGQWQLWLEDLKSDDEEDRSRAFHGLKNLCSLAGEKPPSMQVNKSDHEQLPVKVTMTCHEYSEDIKWKLFEQLFFSKADLAAVLIHDLLDDESRINVPGTVSCENWSYRLPWQIESVPDSVTEKALRLRKLLSDCERV